MSKNKYKWVHIGNCAVDSGQLILVDPCYVLPSNDKDEVKTGNYDDDKNYYTYQELFDLQEKDDFKKSHHEVIFSGIAGTGVRFNSGIGDGCYPVYAKIVEDLDGWGERIVEVKIDLLGNHRGGDDKYDPEA